MNELFNEILKEMLNEIKIDTYEILIEVKDELIRRDKFLKRQLPEVKTIQRSIIDSHPNYLNKHLKEIKRTIKQIEFIKLYINNINNINNFKEYFDFINNVNKNVGLINKLINNFMLDRLKTFITDLNVFTLPEHLLSRSKNKHLINPVIDILKELQKIRKDFKYFMITEILRINTNLYYDLECIMLELEYSCDDFETLGKIINDLIYQAGRERCLYGESKQTIKLSKLNKYRMNEYLIDCFRYLLNILDKYLL